MLVHIDKHREEALRKGDVGRQVVEERFMEARVLGRLRDLYRAALQHARGLAPQ
jgi:hypothetical protein